MSPDKQRIAIAGACGFKPGTFTIKTCWFDDCVSDGQEKVLFAEHFINGPEVRVPDYLNSLDAMHEAEKTISGSDFETELWTHYLINLGKVVNKRRAHATAAQRAEAFLRTLDLWKA
jgi:hypothetical protein